MIDLQKLYNEKHTFGFFAQQLTYPEKINFHPSVMEESVDSSHPAYVHIKTYWELMHDYSFDDIQEMYTYTFDFQTDSTLFMTYVKYQDAKDRGQMLAKLKVLYEMFGLNMPDGELSDFLPLMCEFIYACEWIGDPRAEQSFGMLLAVLEDGTYHLLKALEKYNSPYFHLIKGMRVTFKSCARQEAPTNG
ncbi:nitrate reductase molybdenum cofactor assembly chaperone [Sporosarcina sp. FSL K6-1540]|uniref:nitrate reductase molybdenum cofactor assembly chaperone n=1 Tax=Sporosarcina TaxID=1569 RepID=UPI00078B636F|nr:MULTISPECIES: nitrate reductase molybdenum cofactor assembly chaperone [Sporosarcina]AMQ08079.1 nitrate reductase [Sporosarcina psychrophila]QNK87877.1 nitrate reductase molybdenum cofactor assembly chaperone [Sporosarcina sp. resist]